MQAQINKVVDQTFYHQEKLDGRKKILAMTLNEQRYRVFNQYWPYGNKLLFGSTLKNVKNLQVLKNIVSLKQCNWFKCMTKKVLLRRCKRCKSVCYCSNLCQKKDWKLETGHRLVCRTSQSRDYSFR